MVVPSPIPTMPSEQRMRTIISVWLLMVVMASWCGRMVGRSTRNVSTCSIFGCAGMISALFLLTGAVLQVGKFGEQDRLGISSYPRGIDDGVAAFPLFCCRGCHPQLQSGVGKAEHCAAAAKPSDPAIGRRNRSAPSQPGPSDYTDGSGPAFLRASRPDPGSRR